jgi:hypothetical protein
MRAYLGLLCIALGAMLGAGCDLYFSGDDDPCANVDYGYGGAPGIAYELRDPATGQCVPGPGGYPYPCDDRCGPCPLAGEAAQPDMAACYGYCDGLDEASCQATDGCYAAYLDDPAIDTVNEYWGCWQTAPSGPVQGRCDGLDAHECSRHDDCTAHYAGGTYGAKFEACAPEPGAACLGDDDCGPGSRCDTSVCNAAPGCGPNDPCPDVCYGVCVPTNLTCASVDCGPGYHCEDQCMGAGTMDTTPMTTCAPVCVQNQECLNALCALGTTCIEVCQTDANGQITCGPQCVPDPNGNPGSCYGTVLCDALPPACPSGTVAGILNGCYTGYCIPTSACGPNDPGTCTGDVTCFANPPACPSGTVAGIVNGCWSGYCIPAGACPVMACEALTTESACASRNDCTPVYAGTNCTCYPGYCECETLTYERCQSAVMF